MAVGETARLISDNLRICLLKSYNALENEPMGKTQPDKHMGCP